MALSMILALLGAAAILIALGFASHRRASAAADLAALAGATRSLTDERQACLAADVVARANGAVLDQCELQPGSLVVSVEVDPRLRLLPTMSVVARAGRSN